MNCAQGGRKSPVGISRDWRIKKAYTKSQGRHSERRLAYNLIIVANIMGVQPLMATIRA